MTSIDIYSKAIDVPEKFVIILLVLKSICRYIHIQLHTFICNKVSINGLMNIYVDTVSLLSKEAINTGHKYLYSRHEIP